MRAAFLSIALMAATGKADALQVDWTAAPMNFAHIYQAEPEVAASYVAGMTAYRVFRLGEPSSRGHRLLHRDRAMGPYTWVAEGGSVLRRQGDGDFSLSRLEAIGGMQVQTECFAMGWPNFFCTDGRERDMAAPDLETVIFDGVTYTRRLAAPRP